MLIILDCQNSLGKRNKRWCVRLFECRWKVQTHTKTGWYSMDWSIFPLEFCTTCDYEKGKPWLVNALRTLGLWTTSTTKEDRVVCRDFGLLLLEGSTIQPFVSSVTEMLQDLCLVIQLDSIPFHRMGTRAQGARLSATLILEIEESTRSRLKAVWE